MDKYDVLMNLKRQGTGSTPPATTTTAPIPSTTAPPATSTASTPTSASPTIAPTTSTPPETNTNTGTTSRPAATSSAIQTSSASPTPTSTPAVTSSPSSTPVSSSSAPPTSSAAPTSSSAPVTSSASATPSSTSIPVTSSSSTPATSSSVASSTPVTSSSQPVTSSPATSATSSAATSSAVLLTTSRSVLTVPANSITVVPTTSDGQVFTVTAIVGSTGTANQATAAKKPFFQNTGAVVGVFVVVGIAATALAVMIVTMFIRRRRAKRFDRDVQEAAREAAQAQAPIDDDDYAQGSYQTHASQPMSTERPTGYGAAGYGGASSWDPYGRAPGGYEMQHRRTSTGTAPGMAGFAAGDVFARSVGVDAPQAYNQQSQAYGQQGYGQQQGYNDRGYNDRVQAQAGYQTYNNTSPPQPQAQSYALAQPQGPAQGRAPVQAQMMLPEGQRQSQNYNTVGAYRASPSYGEAHPGEHVEYGHADNSGYGRNDNTGYGYAYGGEDQPRQGGYVAAAGASPGTPAATRMPEEDPYGGYEAYDSGARGGASTSQAHGSEPPAYAPGSGSVTATGDRKRGGGGGGSSQGQAASVGRRPSGKSAETRYSQDVDDDSDGSAYEQPPRRVLKVANE